MQPDTEQTLEKAHTANLIENMLNQQHEMCCTESPLVLDGTRLRASCSSGRWHWRVGTGWLLGSFPIQTIQWFYDSIANACCLWSTNRTIKMWKSLQNLLFTPYTSRTQSDLSKNFSLVRISRFQVPWILKISAENTSYLKNEMLQNDIIELSAH